jgi:hypothetical protein
VGGVSSVPPDGVPPDGVPPDGVLPDGVLPGSPPPPAGALIVQVRVAADVSTFPA